MSKTVREDLADRLGMLNVRYAVAFATTAVTPTDLTYRRLTEVLEIGLQEGVAEDVARVRALVDPAELNGLAFWTTPLGRLLFAAGGYGEGNDRIGQAFAASILDVSRQYVNQLVSSGKLARGGGTTMVMTEGVRRLLLERLDGRVKEL